MFTIIQFYSIALAKQLTFNIDIDTDQRIMEQGYQAVQCIHIEASKSDLLTIFIEDDSSAFPLFFLQFDPSNSFL